MSHKIHYYLSLPQSELMLKRAVPKLARRLARIGEENGEGDGELKSHKRVIAAARKLIRRAKVEDVTAVFELGFSGSSKRVDLMFIGKNKDTGKIVIILIEMKDFDNTISLPVSEEERRKFKISTDTYGLIDHPSLKAKDYQNLLFNSIPELMDDEKYKVLSYGHAPRYKWEMNPVLFNAAYAPVLEAHHCFDRETEKHLVEIIRNELSGGYGEESLNELISLSKYEKNRNMKKRI